MANTRLENINDKMLDKYDALLERCNKYGFLPPISNNKAESAVKLESISDEALTENVGDLVPHQKYWWNTYANWTKSFHNLQYISNTENAEENKATSPRATI